MVENHVSGSRPCEHVAMSTTIRRQFKPLSIEPFPVLCFGFFYCFPIFFRSKLVYGVVLLGLIAGFAVCLARICQNGDIQARNKRALTAILQSIIGMYLDFDR